MYNFKLYPALHKLGSRLLIRFLQCIAHVGGWGAVNVATIISQLLSTLVFFALAYRCLVAGICATLPPVTVTEVVSVDRPPEGGICWL